ncbi:hypothetical protein GCM10022252_53540 [Streptosporangium oxazolinicum]|uniref:Uncharacterized protein n=1 Tax=Streptosporangium oxazolinicum TaxID=909287 RepID=A0ABP8B7Z1_9ACTN
MASETSRDYVLAVADLNGMTTSEVPVIVHGLPIFGESLPSSPVLDPPALDWPVLDRSVLGGSASERTAVAGFVVWPGKRP